MLDSPVDGASRGHSILSVKDSLSCGAAVGVKPKGEALRALGQRTYLIN